MTDEELKTKPKPDWWKPENWLWPDGTPIETMELEAWTLPKDLECSKYCSDLLIKAQNEGKSFSSHVVKIQSLVATIDWLSAQRPRARTVRESKVYE